MRPGIKIELMDADLDRVDGLSEFWLRASNGSCTDTQQFYLQRDGFKVFARQLSEFPADIQSRVGLTIGGPEERWATYLQLDVFCYEPTGASAIKVVMDTRRVEPYYCKSVFFITCYPASLNQLGMTLANWDPLEEPIFEWLAE